MKRNLTLITISSILSMAVYIILYPIWGAIAFSAEEHPILAQAVPCTVSTLAFVLLLFYWTKIRRSAGEKETIADYRESTYRFSEDFKMVWERESALLITIAAIILICFLLNGTDRLIFGKKTFSIVTMPFAPMFMFDIMLPVPFLGYLLNAVLIIVLYDLLVLLHRRNAYGRWYRKKEE